jgi:uncharacterized protein (DUF2267 family)
MSYAYQNALKHSVESTNEWIARLDELIGWQDRDRSFHVMRATLHALREVLPIPEIAQLSAQMPIFIRGLFYEEWSPSRQGKELHNSDRFLQHVSDAVPGNRIGDPAKAVTAVFVLLNYFITAGEINDVRANLRESMRKLWPDPIR